MSSYELALSPRTIIRRAICVRVNQSASGEGPNPDGRDRFDQTDFGTEDNEEAELAEAIRRSLEETSTTEVQTGEERWVGQVLSLSDGKVRVLWVDGSKEEVAPLELLLVPDASGEDRTIVRRRRRMASRCRRRGPWRRLLLKAPSSRDDDDSDDEDTSPFAIVEEPRSSTPYGHTAPHQVPSKAAGSSGLT